MEPAQCGTQFLDSFGQHEDVIVIRQDTPGVDCGTEFATALQNGGLTRRHSFRILADDVCVFEASSRDQVLMLAL